MNKESRETEFKIPATDVLSVLKKRKMTIALSGFFFALLMGGIAFLKPIKYLGEATFREKNSNSQSGASSLATMLLNDQAESKSEAKGIMKSKKLLMNVATELGLQASLTEIASESKWMKRIRENLIVESHYLRGTGKYPYPEYPIKENAIAGTTIIYTGEFPLALRLLFDTESSYRVLDANMNQIGIGKIGSPFLGSRYSFIIEKLTEAPLQGRTYLMQLIPLYRAASELSEAIQIKTEKDNPSLLKLTYYSGNRYLASAVLNHLMAAYQKFLKEEHLRIASEQLSYLNEREEEAERKLEAAIQNYADKLAQGATAIGYADSEAAIEFLTNQLAGIRRKNLHLDVELKKLTAAGNAKLDVQMQSYLSSDTAPKFIAQLIDEIRLHKQQSDEIDLAIRNNPVENNVKWQTSFPLQVAETEELRKLSNEATLLIAQLEKDQFPARGLALMENVKYVAPQWQEQLNTLQEKSKALENGEDERSYKKDWELFKEQFSAYLANLKHYLEVREKMIQERISRQHAPKTEYPEMNLAAGNELFIAYSKQLSEVETLILQYVFLLDRLNDPEFEISSLSSSITDPVMEKLFQQAGSLALGMQDDSNRGVKEKERMKRELETARKFLAIHLDQKIDLLTLQEELLRSKIRSLQNAKLELIQQRISILKKQLSDSIKIHINHLKEERTLSEADLNDLKLEMAALPQKWASETIIQEKLNTNSKMVEEIAKLVESKNIAANLELIQSSPIDLAVPPTHPVRPPILLFGLIGALGGICLSSFGIIAKHLAKGFPASKEALELTGMTVAGHLRKKAPNLNKIVLRRIFSMMEQDRDEGKARLVLIAYGKDYRYFQEISQLLKQQGSKILEMNQFSFEFLTSTKCQELRDNYNWIVVPLNESPANIEIEMLIPFFDYSILNVSGETINELNPLIKTIKKQGKENFAIFTITEDY